MRIISIQHYGKETKYLLGSIVTVVGTSMAMEHTWSLQEGKISPDTENGEKGSCQSIC